MTLQNLASPLEWPAALMGNNSIGLGLALMDAAGEGAAWVLVAPKTGNIAKIGIFTGTVTTPQSLDVRIETLDASGNPSGSLWAANTNGTQASPASNTWYWVTLTAVAAVTAGDIFCINVQWVSTVGNLNIRFRTSGPIGNVGLPYALSNASATWSKATDPPLVAIEYDDATRPHCGGYPTSSGTTTQNVSTTTTPDEVGAIFQVPFACKVIGAKLKMGLASAVTYAVKLYDSDGTTVLASKTAIDSDWRSSSTGMTEILFSAAVTLTINTSYRLTFLPETNNNHSVPRLDVDSSGTLQSWPGGANFYWTERTDAGAWTDTNTRIPQICLMISALDDGAGGGSAGILVHPGMRGGFV